MGYPLHGQDLTAGHLPGAGRQRLGRRLGEAGVLGPRRRCSREKAAGPPGGCAGCRLTGRGIPRAGMDVLVDGARVGVTTSGTFSPTLQDRASRSR